MPGSTRETTVAAMNAPLPYSGAVGYILGVRYEKGAIASASWHVWDNLDDCRTARRACLRSSMASVDSLFPCELTWPSAAPQTDPPSWYLAAAQKPRRPEVADFDFHVTLEGAGRAIDDIRNRYPAYAAGVTRFLVLGVREAQL